MARRNQEFQTIRCEGGLLPADLLRRVLERNSNLAGTTAEDYGLPVGERINEIITQSWNRLRKHWIAFRAAAEVLPPDEAGTGLTNDRWNLPVLRELGFGLLPTSAGPEIAGRTYAISRFFGPVAVHLVGCGLSLDRRAPGQRGAAAVNPHGLVQEFLNRSDTHLWALLGNGLRLRILRDNQALSRQSFLEFDLEAMFTGEVYSDFVLLWLVAHATRFVPRYEDRPETCWLEQWTQEAEEQGTRALGELRLGVEKALALLGEGFTVHPRNSALREALRVGRLSPTELHAQLLRLVYRLIFLFVAEDRTLDGQSLLHPLDETDAARTARERYAVHYSTGRLREMAGRIKGSRHGDLWRQLQLLVPALSGDPRASDLREALALPAVGSFLWDPSATAALNDAELTNFDLLDCLRNLAFTRRGKVLRPVDYKNLGAEELGGVYESLLALTPQVSGDGARFSFAEFAGNERKTSGSYYTPDSLVQYLLDCALDPVVDEAIKGKSPTEAGQAILALKVCDPAVGSGHFLVGAAHRIARHLARMRALAEGESEPSPLLYQRALRDVIGHCLYGVDMSPMAAELCRVSLWLEALEPGKPLSFLDHHIRVGNSLLGTTAELIAGGLPDDAFKPIEGDDRTFCTQYKRQNKQEREGGQMDFGLPMVAEPAAEYHTITDRFRGIEAVPDASLEDVKRKAAQFRRLVVSPEYRHWQQVADAWCAAFVWPKHRDAPADAITTETLRRFEADAAVLSATQREELERLSGQYQFFHWHLAFPEVFAQGGFDCVLGNPPWERVNVEARQFFGGTRPDIAGANTSRRRKLLQELASEQPTLWHEFRKAQRGAACAIAFFQRSGLYPHLNQARLNTYVLFTELAARLSGDVGHVGMVVPSGIVTDDTSKNLFKYLISNGRLRSVVDFENREGLFPGVHRSYRFCLLTLQGRRSGHPAQLAFFLGDLSDLVRDDRVFSINAGELNQLSPITNLCPTFRTRPDKELVQAIYRRIDPLIRQQEAHSDWVDSDFYIMFRSDDSAHLYRSAAELGASESELRQSHLIRRGDDVYAPVWESKLIHQFDHRFATFLGTTGIDQAKGSCRDVSVAEKQSTADTVPRKWVSIDSITERLEQRCWDKAWTIGYRDITNATNERTAIAACLPVGGAAQPLNLFLPESVPHANLWLANMNSVVLDYLVRQRISGVHLNITTCRQIPIIGPFLLEEDWELFVRRRVVELSYTSDALQEYARDCGWDGPAFRWDEERRFLIRSELDAAFFHLYLPIDEVGNWCLARSVDGRPYDETPEQLEELKRHFPRPRDAVNYILDSFPIVRRKDEAQHGKYRTKRVILGIYDAMQDAIRTGQHYQTQLNPPPGPPLDAVGNFVSYADIVNNPPPHIHSPREVGRLAAVDLGSLVDGAWARPIMDQRAETGVQLAAILKGMTAPLPVRQIRLSALLALEPRLLLDYLNDEEAATWRRLIGAEADPLPQGALSLVARIDQAWGAAVRNLRTNGQLIEHTQTETWEPGDNLYRFPTSGWPDGRARMVLDVLRRHSTDVVITALPPELRNWIDAAAA